MFKYFSPSCQHSQEEFFHLHFVIFSKQIFFVSTKNFNDLLWKMRTAFACYSDKLENQQAMSNCLYFRCTVMHQKECESAKMAFLHDIISQSELTTMKNEKTTKNKLFCFWWQICLQSLLLSFTKVVPT